MTLINKKTGLRFQQPLFSWRQVPKIPHLLLQKISSSSVLSEALWDNDKRDFLMSALCHIRKGELVVGTSRNRSSFSKIFISADRAIETLNWAEEKGLFETLTKGTPSSGETTIVKFIHPELLSLSKEQQGANHLMGVHDFLFLGSLPLSALSFKIQRTLNKVQSDKIQTSKIHSEILLKPSKKCLASLKQMKRSRKLSPWLERLTKGAMPANISSSNGLKERKRVLDELNRRVLKTKWEGKEEAMLEVGNWDLVEVVDRNVITPPSLGWVQMSPERLVSRMIFTSVIRDGNVHCYSSGGRIYNRLQTFSSKHRRLLKIDGERVVEIDKVASQPSILFALVGKELPKNFYASVGFGDVALGKAFSLVAIGADWKDESELMRCWNGSTARARGGLRSLSLVEIRKIKKVWGSAWSLLGDQTWAMVQKVESDWMVLALKKFFLLTSSVGVPVHDSIVVAESLKDLMLRCMREAWRELFGVEGEFRVNSTPPFAPRSELTIETASNAAEGALNVFGGKGRVEDLNGLVGHSGAFQGLFQGQSRGGIQEQKEIVRSLRKRFGEIAGEVYQEDS
jgi:hypothetical protein